MSTFVADMWNKKIKKNKYDSYNLDNIFGDDFIKDKYESAGQALEAVLFDNPFFDQALFFTGFEEAISFMLIMGYITVSTYIAIRMSIPEHEDITITKRFIDGSVVVLEDLVECEDIKKLDNIEPEELEECLVCYIDRKWYSEWIINTILGDRFFRKYNIDTISEFRHFIHQKEMVYPKWFKANRDRYSDNVMVTRLIGDRLFGQIDIHGIGMATIDPVSGLIEADRKVRIAECNGARWVHETYNSAECKLYYPTRILHNHEDIKPMDYVCIDVMTGETYIKRKMLFLDTDAEGYDYYSSENMIYYSCNGKEYYVCRYDDNYQYEVTAEGLVRFGKAMNLTEWPVYYKKDLENDGINGWDICKCGDEVAFSIFWRSLLEQMGCFTKLLNPFHKNYFIFHQIPSAPDINRIINHTLQFIKSRSQKENLIVGKEQIKLLLYSLSWLRKIGFENDENILNVCYDFILYIYLWLDYNSERYSSVYAIYKIIFDSEKDLLELLRNNPKSVAEKYFKNEVKEQEMSLERNIVRLSLQRAIDMPGFLNMDQEEADELLSADGEEFFYSMELNDIEEDVKTAIRNSGFDYESDYPKACWIGIESDDADWEMINQMTMALRELIDYDDYMFSGIPTQDDVPRLSVIIIG